MFQIEKSCCTCLNKSPVLVSTSEPDSDMISYIDKLKTCINTDTQEFELNEICEACINLLRITYNFLQMVKAAHETLRSEMQNLQLKNNEELTDLDMVYTCKLCDNIFANSLDLQKHCVTVHTESRNTNLIEEVQLNTNESNYVKTFCSISPQHRRINSHEKHSNSVDDANTKCDTNSDASCKHCGQSDKKNHVCKLGNNKGYRCETCGLEFEKNWMMQRHQKRVHAEKKFACDYCDKAFKQSYHLSEHVRLHTGEMNYECNLCGKKFSRVSVYRRHMRSHQAAPGAKTAKTPFLCSICGKSFPYSNCMERHMRVHRGIKKFECSVCSRKFGQSTHLKVHMRVHTGEKPYVCKLCGEGFIVNVKLQKHMLSHESDVKTEEETVFVKMESVVKDEVDPLF